MRLSTDAHGSTECPPLKRHESSKVEGPRKETERQLASKTEGDRWGCFLGMGGAAWNKGGG